MTVPVLIPARNEADHIAATLGSLPDDADPFVIPNGCDDDTAEIAEDCGANVLEGSPEGKLPALQFAIHHLGERALEPFICLDADSRPRFPYKWIGTLLKARSELNPNRPAVVTGSHLFEGLNPAQLLFKNLKRRRRMVKNYENPNWFMSGANMLMDLKEKRVVQAIQGLPNIWPGEDAAIRDIVVEHSGQLANTIDPKARVMTDAAGRFGYKISNADMMRAYREDAPPGSITYLQYTAHRQLGLPFEVNLILL